MTSEIKKYIESLPHAGDMALMIYDYHNLGYRTFIISNIEVKPIGMGLVRWMHEGNDREAEIGARKLQKYLNYPDTKRKKKSYTKISPNSYSITCTAFDGTDRETFEYGYALKNFQIVALGTKPPLTATMISYFQLAQSIGVRWVMEDSIFKKRVSV